MARLEDDAFFYEPSKKDFRIRLRLDEDLYIRLTAAAAKLKMRRLELIRVILEAELEDLPIRQPRADAALPAARLAHRNPA